MFGGGGTETFTIKIRPLYWGMGANRQEMYTRKVALSQIGEQLDRRRSAYSARDSSGPDRECGRDAPLRAKRGVIH